MAAEVTIRCMRTVPSTKAIEPGTFFPISAFSHCMEKNSIRIVQYYNFSGKRHPTMKLIESLSEALTYFPVITGRVQMDKHGNWEIKCNDAGLRVMEATVKLSIDEWIRNADDADELKLTYWEDMPPNPYFWSPFYIQITEFLGGGLAIGLSCSSLVADIFSAPLLIQTWANFHLTRNIRNLPRFDTLLPNLCKHNPEISNGLIECYKSMTNFVEKAEGSSSSQSDRKYLKLSFIFSDDMVKKCIQEVQGNSTKTPTAFEALASVFWVSVGKAKGTEELSDVVVCQDIRKNLGVSKDFFGNAMISNKVCGYKMVPYGCETLMAYRALSSSIDNIEREDLVKFLEWLESNRDEGGKFTNPKLQYGSELIFFNMQEAAPYSTIFERGVEALRVSYHVFPLVGDGQVFVFPSQQGNKSMEVMALLPEHQIKSLRDNPIILSYSPTILSKMYPNIDSLFSSID